MRFLKTIGFFIVAILLGACNMSCASHFENRTPAIKLFSPVDDLISYNVIIMGPDMRGRCGGTLLNIGLPDEYYVLTASHCVLDNDSRMLRYGYIEHEQGVFRFKIESLDRRVDLALLRVTDEDFEPNLIAELSPTGLNVAQPIWVIGFGAGIKDVVTRGIVSKLNENNWSGQPNTLLDVTAFYGNSGGGVFNNSHELIGVIIQIGPGGPRDGWVFAVRLEDIYKFLERFERDY